MILATLNLSSGEWDVVEDEDLSTIFVGFTSDTSPTSFSNLSFGWTLKIFDEEVYSFSYPKDDVTYLSTDQKYLESESIAVNPDDECTITLWADESEKHHETEYNFVVPRPPSPYPSWVWNADNSYWEAPVSFPEDGKQYVWDEPSVSWIIYGLED